MSGARAASNVTRTPARSEGVNDQPSATDAIGFKPFVDALAQLLMAEETVPPLTVSLEGEWGSGKSSFIAQLKASVTTRGARSPGKEPHVVSFNAWRHDKDEAMWASFALEFTRQVAPRSPVKRYGRALELRLRQIEWPRLVLQGALPLSLTVLIVGSLVNLLFFPMLRSDASPSAFAEWWTYLKRWGPAALASPLVAFLIAALRRALAARADFNIKNYIAAPAYDEKIGFLERFHEDFAHYVETYLKDRRTFVFVDDLDRCEIPKAAELLQALSLMLPSDAPLLVVVAMDRQKVAAGIAARHMELLRFLPSQRSNRLRAAGSTSIEERRRRTGLDYGYEFVEKFVQLSIRVPRLSEETLGGFLDDLLDPREGAAAADHQSTSLGAARSPESAADAPDVVTSDSEQLRQVTEMVAPALGFNPRRLKQFLNLFRLRCIVAWNTGQLRGEGSSGWTLHQLGKVVAMEVRWPRLLDHLLEAPDDLRALSRSVPSRGASDLDRDAARPLRASIDDAELLDDLLAYRREGEPNEDYYLEQQFARLPTLYGAQPSRSATVLA